MTDRSQARRTLALDAIVLFLLAVVPYLNTLVNGFVYDDNTQVLNNPYILNFDHLRAIFTTTAWSYVGKQGLTNYYRPMMTVGYLFCHKLFGMLAYGYHLMNVLLFAASVLVLFAVAAHVFKRREVAFLAAALFALHPVHTEVVAWIAGVTGLELTFFYLLAFWFFLRLPQSGGGRSGGAMLGMMLSFLLALLSKEQAVTLPALATLYEYACREDRGETGWAGKLARYGPLWLLLAAYLLFRVNVLGAIAPVVQLPHLTWRAAILSAFALIAQYAGKLFWPVHLCAFYVFHPSSQLLEPRVIAGLAMLGAGTVLFIVLWNRARVVSFALAWFMATLAPVLNARWMAANVFAERYLYLPSIGFCWLVAWVGIKAWDAAGVVEAGTGAEKDDQRVTPSDLPSAPRQTGAVARLLLAALAGFIAVAAMARIVTRNRDWRDDIALYTKTLAQSPDAYEILNNLGTVYWRRGRMDDARRCWERALELRPAKSIFLNNMGLYYAGERRYALAESYYQRAMRAQPGYTDPHLNLGSLLLEEGNLPQAQLQLEAAVALSPLDYSAHDAMARLDLARGRPSQAEVQFKESLAARSSITALDGLATLDMKAGHTAMAEQEFKRALVLNTDDSRARFGLAALDASTGLVRQAVAQYQAGLRTDPRNALARSALETLELNLDHDPSTRH